MTAISIVWPVIRSMSLVQQATMYLPGNMDINGYVLLTENGRLLG